MSDELKTMKQDTYLKVTALLYMAHLHKAKVDEYELALQQLVGEDPDGIGGYCGDAVWEGYSADKLIEKLGFDVEKEGTK